ncbi:hypothetical protein ACPPVT_09650 [Angustibacter sp. McL0619]|uniref:hypothetical protein n=1 Tax=Angustibacter sp. McL0619 TaxID=3415676 RepID=UPI003CE69012
MRVYSLFRKYLARARNEAGVDFSPLGQNERDGGQPLSVDGEQLAWLRFDYDAQRVPHSHIHVHGQRGALSHLLARTGHRSPHRMSALHLPTGGSRFRPDLEDVIQFLISDCGFDSLPGWQSAVDSVRTDFRLIQARAVTRAMASEAAGELERLGYTITPPPGGHPSWVAGRGSSGSSTGGSGSG